MCPNPTLQEPSWLQVALTHFVALRKTAARLEGEGELLCMPVVMAASHRSSAISLQGNWGGCRHNRTKDVHVQPLTEAQMQAVILDFAKRAKDVPVLPSSLPPQLLLLLQLTGGNPRILVFTLCLLAGSSAEHSEMFPAGWCRCYRRQCTCSHMCIRNCYIIAAVAGG